MTPTPEAELTVRLTKVIPNPPTHTFKVEIISDGQVVLGSNPWTTRSLTAGGLDQVGQEVLAAPLLQASADYPAQVIQLSDPMIPVGMIHPLWTFTLGEGAHTVVVTSAAWLGDEAEAQYFVPSPEREELDRLANLLVSIPDWVTSDGWTTASWARYEAASYLLWVTVWPAPVPDGLPSAAGVTWPFEGPIEGFGEAIATGISEGRCGYLEPTAAADMLSTLGALGVDPTRRFDVTTDAGWVGLYLTPRTVVGFPTCNDAAPWLPPYPGS